MCGCQTDECSCHHDSALSGYWVLGDLGALTPDEAAEKIIARSASSSFAQKIRGGIIADVQAGQLLNAQGASAYQPGTADCSATGQSGNVKLAQTAAGLALTGVSAGLMAAGVAAAALAPWTMGISTIIGLLPMIFGHHAQAVKKEQSVLCAAVPAANNYLQIIDQAVQSGAATPQDGIRALDSLLSDFRSQVSSIIKGSDPAGSTCNAACVMVASLHGIVLEKQSEYQDLIDGAAQQVVPNRPNTTAPAGTTMPASSYASFYGQPASAPPSTSSDWLPIAAVIAAGFLFMKGL